MNNKLLIPPQTFFYIDGYSDSYKSVSGVFQRIFSKKLETINFPLFFYNTLFQAGVKKFIISKPCSCDDKKIIEDKFGYLPTYLRKRFKLIKLSRSFYKNEHELFHLFIDNMKDNNIDKSKLLLPLNSLNYFIFASQHNYSLCMPAPEFDNDFFNNNLNENLLTPLQILEKRMVTHQKTSIMPEPSHIDDPLIIEDILKSMEYDKYVTEHEKLKLSDSRITDVLNRIKLLSKRLELENETIIKLKTTAINTLDWANTNIFRKIEPLSSTISKKVLTEIRQNEYARKRLVYYNPKDILASPLKNKLQNYIHEVINDHSKHRIK